MIDSDRHSVVSIEFLNCRTKLSRHSRRPATRAAFPSTSVVLNVLTPAQHFHSFLNMEIELAITALAALAQETRLSIFRALIRAHSPKEGQGGMAAGEIGDELGVAPATLSFHLKELSHAGLVTSRRDGRSIVYRADLSTMRDLTSFLLDECCKGTCGSVSARKR